MSTRTKQGRPSQRRGRLQVEQLEIRAVLSTTTADFSIDYTSYEQDKIIVRFAEGVTPTDNAMVASYEHLGGNSYSVHLVEGVSVSQAVQYFSQMEGVTYAQLDYLIRDTRTPNDTSYSSLWAMNNTGQSGGTSDADIDAPEAWDITTGSKNIIVAVIDTGVDYTHNDLKDNAWKNTGEIAGNGKDDDGNGYTDDVYGYDFANNDSNPMDDNGHGTHVAGTIGATGNNSQGVVGVNWSVSIMAVKFLSSSGSGSTSNAVKAIYYAVNNGAKILNNSWGGGGYDQSLADAINYAKSKGVIFVAAAGNSSANNDTTNTYPANYNYDNVVSVAATDRNDRLASYSNYGKSSVDLAAPGSSILSTTPNNTYATYSGTSMATPHVAGAMALVWAKNPNWTYSQVIEAVVKSVDKKSNLTDYVSSGGRLNVYNALNYSVTQPAGPQVTAASFSSSASNSIDTVTVTFSSAININSFVLNSNVKLTGPSGSAVSITSVTAADSTNTKFIFKFASQTTAGTYNLSVGPSITDTSGRQMDQNKDGKAGQTNDVYTTSYTLTVTRTYSATPNASIPDRSTVSSTITVSDSFTISDVNVKINIRHTYDSDLIIQLVGPADSNGNRTTITLVNRRGGSRDNFTNTTLDDEATTRIRFGRAPFSGSYKPDSALSTFDGRNARGQWTLVVRDVATRDVGTLVDWSITFNSSSGSRTRSEDTVDEGGSCDKTLPDMSNLPAVPSFAPINVETNSTTPTANTFNLSWVYGSNQPASAIVISKAATTIQVADGSQIDVANLPIAEPVAIDGGSFVALASSEVDDAFSDEVDSSEDMTVEEWMEMMFVSVQA